MRLSTGTLCAVDVSPYFGTMYPQVGAMLEAFGEKGSTIFLGEPIVCHRTQTAEEKRLALGDKASEMHFMSNWRPNANISAIHG